MGRARDRSIRGRLKAAWKRAVADGRRRDGHAEWTLAAVLKLTRDAHHECPAAVELAAAVDDFVARLWLAVHCQDHESTPTAAPTGISLDEAVEVARTLDQMLEDGELKRPTHLIRADSRRRGGIVNAIKEDQASAGRDEKIANALNRVRQEELDNATQFVADKFQMSPANVRKRVAAHLKRQKEKEQEKKIQSLRHSRGWNKG